MFKSITTLKKVIKLSFTGKFVIGVSIDFTVHVLNKKVPPFALLYLIAVNMPNFYFSFLKEDTFDDTTVGLKRIPGLCFLTVESLYVTYIHVISFVSA